MSESRAIALSKQIESAIITGRWSAGEKLPAQPKLMREFDVSRTCLREAISLLQARGLLTVKHGSGCYVENLFESQFAERLLALPASDPNSQQMVMEMREVLEGQAVWYACQRASDHELELIDKEFKRMQDRVGKLPVLQRAKADLTYHMLIARYSHNVIVASLSQLLYSRSFNTIYAALSSGMLDAAEDIATIDGQHEELHQSLMQRDGATALQAAQVHARHTSNLLREAIAGS